MEPNTQTSDAEAEQAGTKEARREARFLNPKTLKRAFKVLVFGLKLWRLGAKLWEWLL
tara:strand:- start:961 stop:1134 length:174 start_codon:yes stop_codon:yes gene_type:complete